MQYLPTYKDSLLRETKMDTSANISFGDINEDGIPDIGAGRTDATNVLYFGSRKLKK